MAIEPSWDLYRTFLAVLREGSLSAAARSLGLTQPTIGRHIDTLEKLVGFQLFVRSRHGLAATDAALELRPHLDADIAVRMVEPRQEALLVQRIGAIKVGLYAHRRYLDRFGTPKTMDQLDDHALIGFDRETTAIRSMQRRLPALRRNQFSLRADSDPAQLAAIRASFGIGTCPVALATY